MSALDEVGEDARWKQKEYLYTVLNLPVYASEADIKDRHRALSLIYHPDKQRDERTKDTAMKSFLEIQKAYEILSDPFLRVVYDTLGYDGIKLKIPEHFRSLPHRELIDALRGLMYTSTISLLESRVHAKGHVSFSVDVRELFAGGALAREWRTDMLERLRGVKVEGLGVQHSFEKEILPGTTAVFTGKMNQGLDDDALGAESRESLQGNIVAAITHQYSPSIRFACTANLLRKHLANISASYMNKGTSIEVGLSLMPRLNAILPFPPLTVSLRRRLFPDSRVVGSLDLGFVRKLPSVGLGFHKPNVGKKGDVFNFGWSCGVDLNLYDGGPRLHGASKVIFQEYGTGLELGLQFTMNGLVYSMSGEWQNESGDSGIEATVGSSVHGVFLRMNMRHLGQTVTVPILFSSESSTGMMILASVIPTAAYVLSDYLVLRSRREKRRAARRNRLLRTRDDYVSERRREASEAISLMTDAVRRIIQAEKERDGLVIQEASYFPLEDNGDIMSDLTVNVTLPLQALVHNGQLFVPGGRSKSALRGFYDPLPVCKKRLAVRYEFRSRLHYAEFHESDPVILPLECHLVSSRT